MPAGFRKLFGNSALSAPICGDLPRAGPVSYTHLEQTRFCNTFGRFIGGLIRYYQISYSSAALTLACKLADIALKTVVLEDGSFDPNRTAMHLSLIHI